MFKAKKQTPAKDATGKGRRRLTRAERREIDAAIRRAARTDKKELSAQDSIPYGNVILPFIDRFPKNTELYKIMTTKPQEVSG